MTPIILLPTTTLSLSPSRHLFTHHHSTAPSNFSLESTENFITKSRPSGSKTRFPPVVRREMPAFSTSADEGRAAARRGGAGDGSSCPRAEPRRREDGTRPDLSMERILIFMEWTWSLPSSQKHFSFFSPDSVKYFSVDKSIVRPMDGHWS